MVVRPLMIRLLEVSREKAFQAQTMMAASMPPDMPADMPPVPMTPTENPIDKRFNLGRIEGMVRASSLNKVGDIIEKYPEETVSIIRTWMADNTPDHGKE